MGVTYKHLGDEVLVTTSMLQYYPKVAALASGGFLVTWTDFSSVDEEVDRESASIKGQLYDSDGHPVGEELLLNTRTDATQAFQVVSALPSGGFVAAWESDDGAGEALGTRGIKLQVFGANGSKVGAEILVNTAIAGAQIAPNITTLESGGFVVAWTDTNNSDSRIKAQVFDASGDRVGGEFGVPVNLTGLQALPVMAPLPSGGFVMTWEDNSLLGGDPAGRGVRAQLFNASGTKVGNEFLVNTATAGHQFGPAVATLASGGFVITWTSGPDYHSGSTWDVMGQVFNANGVKVGGEFRVGNSLVDVQMESSVTGLPSGGFIVSWSDGSESEGDTSHWAVRAQAYDARGNPVGDEILVNTFTEGTQQEGELAVLKSGEVVSVWTDWGGMSWEDNESSIKLQMLAPVNVVEGTSNAETLVGTAGDDLLSGFGGDDWVRAGAGSDQVRGGGGADRLDGGLGADSLSGGAGNDTYYVDHANDLVLEESDGGRDTVRSSVGFVLGAALEDLILTGNAAIAGTGNDLANVITGNAASNRIDGGQGADVMRGGGGADFYVVDHVSDRVVEGDGAGADTVESAITYRLGANVEYLVLTGEAGANGTGNSLANRIFGNAASNLLNGGGGADLMKGGAGNDTYVVDTRADRVTETLEGGTDTVRTGISFQLGGGIENLTITGTAGANGTGNHLDNVLTGNGAFNILGGGAGGDVLNGLGGNDQLYGGSGHDRLSGGTGADRFYFDTALNRVLNVDEILDFAKADDTIYLSKAVFGAVTETGILQSRSFHVGSAATETEHRIIYHRETGDLFYDADGVGGAAAILFAQVSPGLELTRLDFATYTG